MPECPSETRARIEALLQNHQYNRRSPKRAVAPLIDVLCYEIDSPFASEVLANIELVARQQRVGMVLTGATEAHLPEPSWVDGVLHRLPLGVILVACVLPAKHKQQLRSRNIPLVMVDPAGAPAPDVPSIGSADWNGGYLATRHLLDLGHRRIGIITGPDNMLASTARLSGYRAALESANVPVDPGTDPSRRVPPSRRSCRRSCAAEPARPADRHLRVVRPLRVGCL